MDRRHGSRLLRSVRVLIVAGGLSLLGLLIAARVLPLPEAEVPLATVVYDTNGQIAARLFEQNRVAIPREDMPEYLRQAVVAIEDERFYRHFGIDPIAILRAIREDIRARRIVEGGSTLTQQLARNLFLTQERTLIRKAYEALITLQLETRLPKEEILTMYLNVIYFGHGAYGVEAASQIYFGKHTRDLDLAESAMLAAIIQVPEVLTPYRNPEAASRRQAIVLAKMVQQGFITQREADEARDREVELSGLRLHSAPYFVDYMMHEIRSRHPEVARNILTGGYSIYATLDRDMQQAAERILKEALGEGKPDANGITQPQAAVIAVDPSNGHIRALVGGRDYRESTYNRAYQAKRQPGSAMKPFLYTALIDMGIPATRTQRCEEVEFQGRTPQDVYKPRDIGRQPYHDRDIAMREAMRISDNVVAVRWAYEVGPRKIAEYARKMGIESNLDPYLSLALGSSEVTPLELTVGYATLANLGLRVTPMSIIRIEDRFGNVIEENQPRLQRVLPEPVAYVVTDLLTGVLGPGGTASHLARIVGRPAAGKTGSTDDLRDAWFVGYTPELVATVWVGHDSPSVPVGATGGAVAGPIWARFVAEALEGVTPRHFVRPLGVIELEVCSVTGLLPNRTCNTVREVFVAGTEPTEVDPTVHWENWENWAEPFWWRQTLEEDILEDLAIFEDILNRLFPETQTEIEIEEDELDEFSAD